MQQFDVTLKLLLRAPSGVLLRTLSGGSVVRWLEVETLKVEARRMDLLCRMSDGGLLHLELQSSNDPEMPLRMAEYALAVKRKFGRIPRQIVLYVGRSRLRMTDTLKEGSLDFRYELVDFRKLDGEALLASPDLGDNVLAVLARLNNRRDAVSRIISRIGNLKGSRRDEMIAQLTILAGLRGLEETVQEAMENMPIVVDLMKNKILAKGYLRAEALGEARGEARGKAAGERTILLRLMQKRFGTLPHWVDERLADKTSDELEQLGLRLLDAQTLGDLME